MKYVIRAIKSFILYCILFAAMTAVIYLTSTGEGVTIESLYQPGAIPKIFLFFAVIAAIYPAIGYVKREVILHKDFKEVKELIDKIFSSANYVNIFEDDQIVVYRSRSKATRLMRLYEDHITIDKTENPICIKGLRKDATKLANAIEHKINKMSEYDV